MKLTTKHGTYVKRANKLCAYLAFFLDADEPMIRDGLESAMKLVRYFSANKVYLSRYTEKVKADTRWDGECGIAISASINDGAIESDGCITLYFPKVEDEKLFLNKIVDKL